MLTENNLDTVTSPRDLLSETYAFYKNFHSSEICDKKVQEKFLGGIPKLTEEESELCEGELKEEEVRKPIYSLENDNSPGIDGLTGNFYKQFWALLGNSLTHVYNHAFHV